MTIIIHDRAAWGARPPRHDARDESGIFDPVRNPAGWQVYRRPLTEVLNTLVIHHSALDPAIDAAQIQRLHMDKMGLADIAYHFVVDAAGIIWAGRDIGVRGAHVRAANTGTVGIVLLGNFEHEAPPPLQAAGLARLAGHLAATYAGLTHLAGHADFNDETVCPGRYLQPRLPSLAQKLGLSFGTGGYRRPNWA